EEPCAKLKLLQEVPQRIDSPPEYAGDDDRFDARCEQVDLFLRCNYGEAERIRGRAAEDRGVVVHHHAQTGRAAQAAARKAEAADALRRFIGEPEADERSERKREKDTVVRGRAGRTENLAPAFNHPVPAF